MSLHANLSPEAIQRLKRQDKMSAISSCVIALLTICLIGVVLGIFLLPKLLVEPDTIVTYESNSTEETDLQQKKVVVSTERRPSSPSSSMARVIAANTSSQLSIPVPTSDVSEASLDFGDGDDFGNGWGDGGGSSGGGSSGFGSLNRISGALVGSLYDFKQDRRGDPYSGSDTDPSHYGEIVERIQRRGFSQSAFSHYFKAPNELSLTSLAIPYMDADQGPRVFGAEKHMQPRMWLAHYSGDVLALEPGTYRFVGMADDYVSVFINSRPVLIARRPDMAGPVDGRWKPAKESGVWQPPFQQVPLTVGDWVKFEPGQKLHMDLSIGERPGGALYFFLLVQKKGEDYQQTGEGRPILPLFTTAPFSDADRERITREFGKYQFEWNKVPVFPAQ